MRSAAGLSGSSRTSIALDGDGPRNPESTRMRRARAVEHGREPVLPLRRANAASSPMLAPGSTIVSSQLLGSAMISRRPGCRAGSAGWPPKTSSGEVKMAAVAIWCAHDVSSRRIAEHHRREIGAAGEVPRERQGRIVPPPRSAAAMLESVHAFARQFVRPRPRFAGRLVRAVEVDHEVELRRLPQDRLVRSITSFAS